MPDNLDGLLAPAELASELGVSVATLRQWRWRGEGPAHIKLNSRVIRYKADDVDAWLARRDRVEDSDVIMLAKLRKADELESDGSKQVVRFG